MNNFLKETLDFLKDNNLSEKDVLWVGNEYFYFTFEHFKKISDFEYDSGYGSPNIVMDLIICGKDWWIERAEYDGSEWWEFKKMTKKPEKEFNYEKLNLGMWKEMGEIK